jgi:hypothetical protein
MTDIAGTLIYQSSDYNYDANYEKYIRFDGRHFLFIEVDPVSRMDFRQGIARTASLKDDVKAEAIALWETRAFPSYVRVS